MSATRFGTLNAAQSAALDTTVGGSARHDDASGRFPFENVFTPDRREVWKSDGTSNIVVAIKKLPFFDMESVFLLGLATTGTLTQVVIEVSTDGTVWFDSHTVALNGLRDAWAFFQARPYYPIWLRFTFTNTGVLTVGRLFAGLQTDLAKAHSPGGEDTPVQNRVEQMLADGSTNITALGDPGASVVLPFRSVTGPDRDQLREVAAWPGSVVLFDTEDAVRECVVVGGQVKVQRRFLDTYDCSLELKRLP